MAIQAVSDYLYHILTPQLLGLAVSEKYTAYLCTTVEMQMRSALSHWRDVDFRKALFLFASEEAPFYEPSAKTDVKSFVVMTLRNSPFESLQSTHYADCGLAKTLSNANIKAITSSAIRFFNALDFDTLSREAQGNQPDGDLYGDLAKKCPVSWKAVTNLATSPAKRVFFVKADGKEPFLLDGLADGIPDKVTNFKAVLDGYSPIIDDTLAQQLRFIASGKGAFVVDCFKALTRNIEKLLCVMEFLLTRDCAFVTSNYYIENGYAERRVNVLKAASCENFLPEMKQHFSLTKGLGPKHMHVLKSNYADLQGE